MIKTQIIEQRELLGKDFKIYGTFENPLFLAKDVANWIEHKKPSEMIQNVDEEEKLKIFIYPSDNIDKVFQSNTEYWFLTEDGLYEVLMQSRKPIAKVFKKEVKKILKSIRKNGFYGTPQKIEEILNDPRNFLKTLEAYAEEKEKNKILQLENDELKEENKIMKPKSNYYDKLIDKELLLNFRNSAKELGLKQKEFIDFLLNKKIVYRDSKGKLFPYAKYVDKGYFAIKEGISNNISYSQTFITVKGREYFIRLLEKYLEK